MNLRILLYCGLLAFLITQCDSKPRSDTSPQQAEQLQETIMIIDGWARPAKAGRMSAAYFKLQNGTNRADTLISATSDATVNTQIHLSYKNDSGLMAMEEQDQVAVPAASIVEFRQGGLHIMLIQPEKDLNPGDSVRVTLNFLSGMELSSKIPVRSPDN